MNMAKKHKEAFKKVYAKRTSFLGTGLVCNHESTVRRSPNRKILFEAECYERKTLCKVPGTEAMLELEIIILTM